MRIDRSSCYLNQLQTYMTLALKAQAQCRATLEALAEIKNPRPVAFVKQANIAQQQQVNNGPAPQAGPVRAGAGARAEENSSTQDELLEAPQGDATTTVSALADPTAAPADPLPARSAR